MAESDVTKLLVPLTLRTDVPQDARDAIAAAIQGTPLSTGSPITTRQLLT
jgi:hypothetical protein